MKKAAHVQFPCSACGGAAHPSSGCFISERTMFCWPCTKEMWREIKGHVRGRGKFYEAARPPPQIDTSFDDTRGDERLCHCEWCTSVRRVVPVYNHGKFDVIRNPSGLQGGEDTWGVAGPYEHARHVGATWACVDKREAEMWCEMMNDGEYPVNEED